MLDRKQALETIEKRKSMRALLGRRQVSDLAAILAYLHRDAIMDMIMKCDVVEIEHAIKYIDSD